MSLTALLNSDRLSKWGKRNFALRGEKKEARRELRRYVRLHRTYVIMPIDRISLEKKKMNDNNNDNVDNNNDNDYHHNDDEGDDNCQSNNAENNQHTIISNAYEIFEKVKKTISSVLVAKNNMSINQKKDALLMKKGKESVELSLIPLEVQYKESLSLPLSTIYDRCKNAQSMAQDLLVLCDMELTYSHFEVEKAQRKLNTPPQRRRVVVDVSSSSSGSSDSEEDNNNNRVDVDDDYVDSEHDEDEYTRDGSSPWRK